MVSPPCATNCGGPAAYGQVATLPFPGGAAEAAALIISGRQQWERSRLRSAHVHLNEARVYAEPFANAAHPIRILTLTAMQLDFLSNSPLNSAVVDAATGETLYTISTPRTLGTRDTTVCDAAGKTVALYRRHWGRGEVELHGVTRDVSSWLVSDGVFSRWAYLIRVQNVGSVLIVFGPAQLQEVRRAGRQDICLEEAVGHERVRGAPAQFSCDLKPGHSPCFGDVQLVDDQTQQLVAKSSGARSVLRPSDRMSLEISPQAVPILDAVVLSFIICEKNRRGNNAATAATVAVV